MRTHLPGTIKQVVAFNDSASILVEELTGKDTGNTQMTTVTAQGETLRRMLRQKQLAEGRHCVINARLVPNHIGGFNIELNTDRGDELLLFPHASVA